MSSTKKKESVPARGVRYSPAQKIQSITLQCLGVPPQQIEEWLEIPKRAQDNIRRKAEERGFDARTSLRVEMEHVLDAPRSG